MLLPFQMRCTAANNLKHSLSCVLQPSHPLAKADALWKLWLQEKAEHRMERLQQLQEEERAAIFREEEGDGPGETSGQGPELLEPPQRLGLEEVRRVGRAVLECVLWDCELGIHMWHSSHMFLHHGGSLSQHSVLLHAHGCRCLETNGGLVPSAAGPASARRATRCGCC